MKFKNIIFFILSAALVVFIFWNGSRSGEVSVSSSDNVTNTIRDIMISTGKIPDNLVKYEETSESSDKSESNVSVNMYRLNILVRKSAHRIEYGLLAALSFMAFFCFEISKSTSAIMSYVLSIVVAFIDEAIQAFTPGRSSSFKDVFIDSQGVLAGIILAVIIVWIAHFSKNKEKFQKNLKIN